MTGRVCDLIRWVKIVGDQEGLLSFRQGHIVYQSLILVSFGGWFVVLYSSPLHLEYMTAPVFGILLYNLRIVLQNPLRI